MKLTVVRHGETVENTRYIIQGQQPGKLTERGIWQAKKRSQDLADENFDAIYCSDLRRCIDTMREIIQHHPDTPIVFTPQLREFSYGIYEGQPTNAMPWEGFPGSLLSKKAPKGESWDDVSKRVIKEINNIYMRHQNEDILIITHGGPIRVLQACLGNVALETLVRNMAPIEHCSKWQWEVHDRLVLELDS